MKSSENLEMPRVPVGITKGQFLASQQKQNIVTTASKNWRKTASTISIESPTLLDFAN